MTNAAQTDGGPLDITTGCGSSRGGALIAKGVVAVIVLLVVLAVGFG